MSVKNKIKRCPVCNKEFEITYRKQGKETDVEYYENIANTIVVQALQKLLEGEK